jgi:hypothetical protein
MRALPLLKRHWFIVSDLSLVRIQIAPVYKNSLWVFRLATMFYAPVNLLPVQRAVLLPALTLGNIISSSCRIRFGIRLFFAGCWVASDTRSGFPLILKKEARCHLKI